MFVEAHSFPLKDGRIAVLRNASQDDIPSMIEYLKVTAAETNYIARSPEDCDRYTPEFEAKIIKNSNDAPFKVLLVCDVNGEIVGNCEITWSDKTKMRHRASIGLAIKQDFWDQGIGTEMLQEMINIAKTVPDIEQVELDVVEGNIRARGLYEKMGFRIVGIKPRSIKLPSGQYLDEYFMIKQLSNISE